jgi:ATP-binding cassette subfamily C protein CydD
MEGVAAAQQALDLLDEDAAGARSAPTVPASGGGTVDLRNAEIRLSGVTLTYPDRAEPALDDVSLVVRPGERLVVVGPSGAGKSSLLALLLRFAEPDGGRITAGGMDLRSVDVEGWRQQIAWVPQRPHLFAGTIADNIRLARPDASDRAVLAAAIEAGLLDGNLPTGLDTSVGERGSTLSSGQRQRVALARAFLRDAALLLLDEPSAHLDADAADLVRAAVERLSAGRTVIIVSHVHGWTVDADRVLTIESGRVAAGVEALAS